MTRTICNRPDCGLLATVIVGRRAFLKALLDCHRHRAVQS